MRRLGLQQCTGSVLEVQLLFAAATLASLPFAAAVAPCYTGRTAVWLQPCFAQHVA